MAVLLSCPLYKATLCVHHLHHSLSSLLFTVLGPMTNVALAIRLDGTLCQRAHLVTMGRPISLDHGLDLFMNVMLRLLADKRTCYQH